MPDTPLNPDALEAASRVNDPEAWSMIDDIPNDPGAMRLRESLIAEAGRTVSAYLAVAQPEVNSVEELDALPIGSVVIINGTMLQADDRDDYGTMWSRVRDIDAYPSEALALPARVLYRPEVKP